MTLPKKLVLVVGLAATPAPAQDQPVTPAVPVAKSESAGWVGLPLPLRADEHLSRFKNGCAAIANNHGNIDVSGVEWIGACRFGLAHGSGLRKFADGGIVGTTFVYGQATWRLTNYVDFSHAQENYVYAWPNTVVSFSKGASPTHFEVGHRLNVDVIAAPPAAAVAYSYGVGSFNCPFTALPEPDPVSDTNFVAEAKALCAARVRGADGKRVQPVAAYVWKVFRERERYWSSDFKVRAKPQQAVVAICDRTLAINNCTQTFRRMLGDQLGKIEVVVAGNNAADAAANAAFAERFAALEAAFKAKARQYRETLRSRAAAMTTP